MSKAVYTYKTHAMGNVVYITDLYDKRNPTMTVTNDAEAVITEIIQKESWINKETTFEYTDSEAQLDEIVPTIDWNKRKCISVDFKPIRYTK